MAVADPSPQHGRRRVLHLQQLRSIFALHRVAEPAARARSSDPRAFALPPRDHGRPRPVLSRVETSG